MRYDDIYRMDEIKVYRFILCSIVYFVVLQNTLFTVILFIIWMTAIFTRHHGAWRGDRTRWRMTRTKRGARPKRGTTSVAWTRVFKHCSFKTTDFKLLKQTTELFACAVSVSVWEGRTFFGRFIGFERLHKHTYMRQNPRLCKYPHKHGDLGLKRE